MGEIFGKQKLLQKFTTKSKLLPVLVSLVDDINFEVNCFFSQVFMHVRYKNSQLFKAISVWDNDS